MNKKVIGIFICMLFIISGCASATINFDNKQEIIEKSKPANRVFVFGIMKNLDFQPTYADYEVTLFAILREGGQGIETLSAGEMVRFNASIILIDFFNIVVAFCEDWGIIG
jgi:hypothetical protein